MNTARIIVPTIALGAGGIAAYLASGSDKPAPAEPAAQLQTIEALVAKSEIGLGQTVKPEDIQWRNWPSDSASSSFIRCNDLPNPTTHAETLARARQTGTLSLALRSIADVNMVENNSDDKA